MEKFAFLLSSEDVPTTSPLARAPGLQRVELELARRGTLGRAFDNKCAHDSATAARGFDNRTSAG